MPSILSKELKEKILGSEWSFGYNCYEVGHAWTPSCTDAALEVSSAAAFKILPLYGALYIFSQVAVQRKYDLSAILDTIKSTTRSTMFIFFHAYNGALLGCALRGLFGRFYYRVLVCAPALISSYLSLLIEKPSRRQTLAFYMLNLASEIVYRMMVSKGYIRPIRYGETLLFASSLAAWYHFIQLHGFGHDPVSSIVKLLIGRDEAKSRSRKSINENDNDNNHDHGHQEDEEPMHVSIMNANTKLLKHPCCPHKESSCFEYIVKPMPSRFLLGYGVQSLLGLAKNPLELLTSPGKVLISSFSSKSSFKFGLFVMTLVSSGRFTRCLLRHLQDSDQTWHASASGFVAGLSMLWSPRSSISMYIMWKAVEQYYLMAASKGQVKYKNFTINSIYSVSAATILYTFALEPQLMRPSYMKFLDNLSNHRLHQLNRMVLDVFGTGASKGYEDFFPDLDTKYMSNQFKELIFNWLIQPYE